jgi:uncharacterized protein (DUF362 family)
MSKIFTARCEGYSDPCLAEMIESYFLENKDRLKSAKRILIKPNLLSATVPERGVTTHPDFVRVVIQSIKKFTDAELWLGDSPGANFAKYDSVLEKTGIGAVAQETEVKVVRVESFEPSEKEGFVYSSLADEVDLIINLPKLKTHSLTGLTLAVKNLFGLIPGNVKVGFHRKNPVDKDLGSEIYRYSKLFHHKTLNILDGILAHEGDGPSRGEAIELGIAAASDDAVALDIAATRMVGLKDRFCYTTDAALNNGYDASDIDIPESNISLLKLPLSKRLYVPSFMKKFVANQVYVKPVVLNDPCIKCMLCKKSCPVDAISLKEGYPFVDKNKCIECYCCHEVCESDAVGLERSWLHKIMVKS